MRVRQLCALLATAASLWVPCAHATNILPNGDFTSGYADWSGQNMGIAGAGAGPIGSGFAATACVGNASVATEGAGCYLDQTLTTVVGQTYTVSCLVAESSGPPSEFTLWWGSTLVADVLNPANNSIENGLTDPGSWIAYNYTGLTATSDSTYFEINGRQNPGTIYFTDFVVSSSNAATAIPEPGSISIALAGILALAVLRRAGGSIPVA